MDVKENRFYRTKEAKGRDGLTAGARLRIIVVLAVLSWIAVPIIIGLLLWFFGEIR